MGLNSFPRGISGNIWIAGFSMSPCVCVFFFYKKKMFIERRAWTHLGRKQMEIWNGRSYRTNKLKLCWLVVVFVDVCLQGQRVVEFLVKWHKYPLFLYVLVNLSSEVALGLHWYFTKGICDVSTWRWWCGTLPSIPYDENETWRVEWSR